MTRLILLVALAALSTTSAYELTNKSIAIKSGLKPDSLTNSVAYKFFEVATEDEKELTTEEYNYGVYNYGLCKKEAQLILNAMDNYEEWGLQFPDSWGRMPMGIFWGHQISMGQYEECVEYRRLPKGTTEEIRGQYCLAKIPVKEIFKAIKPWDYEGESRVTYKLQPTEFFELGMCMPRSCSPKQSNDYLQKVFTDTFGLTYDEKSPAMVRDGKWCDYEHPIELRGIDIFAIVFFSIILAFMLLSSIYDLQMQKTGQQGKPLFLAFSVITNTKKLFKVNDNSKNPNIIECMNGIRCFSMMWVIFGHGYMTFYDLPHINRNKFFTWTETPYSMLVQNATLCVDSFFFMSGLLMLWGAFREMEKTKGKLNIGMMYFHRYIRLTPVVAVVVLYIMSLYKYSGSGPMWMKVGNQDEKCEESWWATLIYVQNYAFPYSICVSQSWYLAVDTQLYVLSPLFLIPLWKWGKKALWPISIFLVLCLGCTFATFMYNDFTLFRVQDNNVGKRQALTYYPTHTRIPSWLLGVIFGYFFFKYNRGKRIPLAKHWVILGWTVAFGTMLACLWGPYWRILPDTPDAPIIEGAFYEPLSRSSWAISVGWIIWACYNGHGGIINDFLSWGFFQAFARLSYCMYVIHRIVQWVTAGRLQTDTHFSDWDYILRWWHEFGITLCAAFVATLAFEAPVLGIEKAIFGTGKPAPKPKTESKEGLTEVQATQPTTSTATAQ